MLDELRRAELVPDPSQLDLAVDVEAFVETHLGLPLDVGAALETDVLGMTEFVPGRRPKISINRDLTEGVFDYEYVGLGTLGRWRATVAHEASHVVLHGVLYEVDDKQEGLFPNLGQSDAPGHLMRCLKRDVGFQARTSDWREVQANKGMAALLMPKPIFLAAFEQERERIRAGELPIAEGSSKHQRLVSRLAGRFSVSRQAAGIRVATLKGVQSADQLQI